MAQQYHTRGTRRLLARLRQLLDRCPLKQTAGPSSLRSEPVRTLAPEGKTTQSGRGFVYLMFHLLVSSLSSIGNPVASECELVSVPQPQDDANVNNSPPRHMLSRLVPSEFSPTCRDDDRCPRCRRTGQIYRWRRLVAPPCLALAVIRWHAEGGIQNRRRIDDEVVLEGNLSIDNVTCPIISVMNRIDTAYQLYRLRTPVIARLTNRGRNARRTCQQLTR